MSEIKVGDKVRVTRLMLLDRINGIVEGGTYEVVELDSDGDGLFVNTSIRNNCGLIYEQIEKVEEDGQVSGFKVGDKVKVISLKSWKDERYLQIGKTYTVDRVDVDGWPLIITDGVLHNMMPSQVEKVEEEERVDEFKPGDKVKVKWTDEQDRCRGVSIGDCFEVLRADGDGDIRVNMPNGERGVLFKRQVELVENKTEFTFPEMAQKLIDGEFEEGTELIAFRKSSVAGSILSNYFVGVNGSGVYGLKEKTESAFISTKLGASDFNATWKVKEQPVKEQPIKEMTIEEIQKELGYKIKVTE